MVGLGPGIYEGSRVTGSTRTSRNRTVGEARTDDPEKLDERIRAGKQWTRAGIVRKDEIMFPRTARIVSIVVVTAFVVTSQPAFGRWHALLDLFKEMGVRITQEALDEKIARTAERIRSGEDARIEVGTYSDIGLKKIGGRYGTKWKEETILTKEEIQRAWEKHVLPRLRQKWRVDEETPSRQQQSALNGICLRAQVREMPPEQVADKLLALGLDNAGLGCINDIRNFVQFLEPETWSKGVHCLVGEKLAGGGVAKLKSRWPKVSGAGECVQIVQSHITAVIGCQ